MGCDAAGKGADNAALDPVAPFQHGNYPALTAAIRHLHGGSVRQDLCQAKTLLAGTTLVPAISNTACRLVHARPRAGWGLTVLYRLSKTTLLAVCVSWHAPARSGR